MTKILFLSITGVLNRDIAKGVTTEPDLVENLLRVMTETDCTIVLNEPGVYTGEGPVVLVCSDTQGRLTSFTFGAVGLPPSTTVLETSNLSGNYTPGAVKSVQVVIYAINSILPKGIPYRNYRFCVIDTVIPEVTTIGDRWVLVDPSKGLTQELADRAIQILNKV